VRVTHDDTDVAVLVGCGKQKQEDKQPVWKLYTSTYFESKMSAAMVMGHPYIVSGKYGLVSVGERVQPYEETWRDYEMSVRRERAREVVQSLPSRYGEVVLLLGRVYADPIVDALAEMRPSVDVTDPFADCSGMGEQMAWCNEYVNTQTEQ